MWFPTIFFCKRFTYVSRNEKSDQNGQICFSFTRMGSSFRGRWVRIISWLSLGIFVTVSYWIIKHFQQKIWSESYCALIRVNASQLNKRWTINGSSIIRRFQKLLFLLLQFLRKRNLSGWKCKLVFIIFYCKDLICFCNIIMAIPIWTMLISAS